MNGHDYASHVPSPAPQKSDGVTRSVESMNDNTVNKSSLPVRYHCNHPKAGYIILIALNTQMACDNPSDIA